MPSANAIFAGLALALLLTACGRPTHDGALPAARLSPPAETPSVLVSRAEAPPAQPSEQPPAQPADPVAEPGYAGVWAMEAADCADPARTYRLSATRIEMAPDQQSCSVARIDEEHPTGRSMIYVVEASCTAGGTRSADIFTFRFGASDTVMQMQLSDRTPVRLVRCPAV